MQIGDRLVGQPAQLLGARGALAQHRDQRLGARQQLVKARRRCVRSVFASGIALLSRISESMLSYSSHRCWAIFYSRGVWSRPSPIRHAGKL